MNDVITQVQSLHALIQDNHSNPLWNVYPSKYEKAMIKLQIELGRTFPSNKKGRERRLETLAAILPLLQSNGSPIEFKTTKVLLMSEIYGLLTWLDDDAAKMALDRVAQAPLEWSQKIRELLPYIQRPVSENGGYYYAPSEQEEHETLPLWNEGQRPHDREREEMASTPF